MEKRPNETQILLMRHEDHQNNILLPEAVYRAQERGRELKAMGHEIDAVFSSPQWRCIDTIMAVLRGHGKMVPLTGVEPWLGDLALDPLVPKDWIQNLKGLAQQTFGKTDDESLARIAGHVDPYYRDVMIRRGREGAEVIWKILEKFRGKTILVCSHAVARLEVTINAFSGAPDNEINQISKDLFSRGEIQLATIGEDNSLIHVETILR